MNNIIIVLSILVLFLVLNTKIDKFYFVMCFLAIYFLYLNMYNKENFIFNNRDNILKLHDKLNFFENNGITKSEYERQNNVTLKIDGDSYTEIPNEEPVEEEEKELVIRIVAPNGYVLTQYIDELSDTDDLYSMVETMTYDGSEKSMVYYYDQEAKYSPGIYQIEIYNDKKLVSQNDFYLN